MLRRALLYLGKALAVSFCVLWLTPAANAGAPLRIMPLGDSITAGYLDVYTWSYEFTFGYRLGLYQRLTQAGYSVQFVGESPEPWGPAFFGGNVSYGVPKLVASPDLRTLNQDHHRGYAWLTAKMANDQVVGWLNTDTPALILLMIGAVDFQTMDVGTVKTNLHALVDTIVNTRPQAQLIVAQMTPYSWYDDDVATYNAYIRDELVPSYAAAGKLISSVDQYANFLNPGSSLENINQDLFSDGNHHPNPKGYDLMAQTWFEGIRKVFPLGTQPVLNEPKLANGQVQVWFKGLPQTVYQVDRAVSLSGPWEVGFTNISADAEGIIQLQDGNPGTSPNRFYRIAPAAAPGSSN